MYSRSTQKLTELKPSFLSSKRVSRESSQYQQNLSSIVSSQRKFESLNKEGRKGKHRENIINNFPAAQEKQQVREGFSNFTLKVNDLSTFTLSFESQQKFRIKSNFKAKDQVVTSQNIYLQQGALVNNANVSTQENELLKALERQRVASSQLSTPRFVFQPRQSFKQLSKPDVSQVQIAGPGTLKARIRHTISYPAVFNPQLKKCGQCGQMLRKLKLRADYWNTGFNFCQKCGQYTDLNALDNSIEFD